VADAPEDRSSEEGTDAPEDRSSEEGANAPDAPEGGANASVRNRTRGARPVIDTVFLILLALLLALVVLAWRTGGVEQVREGLGSGAGLLVRYSALLVVSFLAAGLAESLVPHEWVSRTLGRDSGVRGIVIATGVGALTPAGPFVSMPIAAVMLRAGASVGPVVAFLTGWSLLAVHRTLAWELPILGPRMTALRYGVSLVLPVLAGLLARAITRS